MKRERRSCKRRVVCVDTSFNARPYLLSFMLWECAANFCYLSDNYRATSREARLWQFLKFQFLLFGCLQDFWRLVIVMESFCLKLKRFDLCVICLLSFKKFYCIKFALSVIAGKQCVGNYSKKLLKFVGFSVQLAENYNVFTCTIPISYTQVIGYI